MSRLILVKHAPPRIDPDVIAHRWALSDEGRERCVWLAEALRKQGVRAIYASLEPKALETAALAAVRIGLDLRPRPGLQENDRSGMGFQTPEDLNAKMRAFFERPSEHVVGTETADATLARFEAAVRAALAETADETITVVAHGTVITLLTGRYNTIDAFDFWKGLTLPSLVVLDRETLRLENVFTVGG